MDAQGRTLDFHSLRYFFAKQCAPRMPLMMVKTLMRHADVRMTANLYAELGLTDVAEQTWALPRLFGAAAGLAIQAPQDRPQTRKELRRDRRNPLRCKVGPAGFEPTTS